LPGFKFKKISIDKNRDVFRRKGCSKNMLYMFTKKKIPAKKILNAKPNYLKNEQQKMKISKMTKNIFETKVFEKKKGCKNMFKLLFHSLFME